MLVEEAILTRRSVTRLTGQVADEDLMAMMAAGVHAPNHRLTEPWQFTVVRGQSRVELGRVWGEESTRDKEHLTPAQRDAVFRKEAAKLVRAPVLIVVSLRVDADPVVYEEDFAATAAAVQNMLLVAHARGLGAIWRTGKMVRSARVKQFLQLSTEDVIVAILYVGEPAESVTTSRPRKISDVIRWLDGSTL